MTRFSNINHIVLVVVAVMLNSCAGHRTLAKQNRLLIAVVPFSYKANNPDFSGIESGVADAMSAELARTGKFRVIERTRVEALLKEIQFQQTGLVDQAAAARVGKQLGAQALVVGSVVSVSVHDEWRSVKFAEKTTRSTDIEAEAKLVDVETGEILASSHAIGNSKTAEKHAFGGKIGELATKESMVQKSSQALSVKLAKDLVANYR